MVKKIKTGSNMAVPKIEMQGVMKSFGGKHVLRGIDLSVNAEESLTLIQS